MSSAPKSKKSKKSPIGRIRIVISAGKAVPAPPLGPALGQRGINIPGFCKEFNSSSQHIEAGTPCTTTIYYYQDKSFSFKVHSPPASYLIKKAAGVQKGHSTAGRGGYCGKITVSQLREIVAVKRDDLSASSEEKAMKIISGTARSMGIEVVS